MSTKKSTVFSEYEVDMIGVNFPSETGFDSYAVPCVGSASEEMEVKTASKKCRGVVAKEVTRPTGAGTLKLSLHCPLELYRRIFNMKSDGLADGVFRYGQDCIHPRFTVTEHVTDEDGNVKFKAYPKVTMKSGIARNVENGADEVAEIELEMAIMPDDDNNGFYEALDSELTDDDIRSKWMESFSPELVKKIAA